MPKLSSTLLKKNARQWVSLLLVLGLSVASVNYRYETQVLLTSVLGVQEHDAFDGTVMPLQSVPEWTALSTAEYKMSYQELPQSKLQAIPEYRNDYLTADSSELVWGDSKDNIIRNTKLTYPVPYSGNYRLDDCGEGCGSHPAVDIKAPRGTPVYAVANGIVVKAGTSSGFGKAIVVKHNNVPDPNSPTRTTTLYSSYSHLSELFATEGQEVHKGSVIGQVGDTGTATTYHLHFQLDNADAPWHPYWPFTTADATAAGYDFWDAVNYKVGQDNLYRYTYNPLDWVQDHLDADAEIKDTYTAITDSVTEEEVEDIEDEEALVEETPVEETPVEEISTVVKSNFSKLQIVTPAFIMPGEEGSVIIRLVDGDGDIVKDSRFEGQMQLSVSDSSLAKLDETTLESSDFNRGEADVSFYADHDGVITVKAEVNGRSYVSSSVYIDSSVAPFKSFAVLHDGTFVPGKPETIQIQAQDAQGRPTPAFEGYGNIQLDVSRGTGTLSKTNLLREDFATGVTEVTFKGAKDEPVVITVTYGKKVVESKTLTSALFNDFSETDEYYSAVSYLFRKGTVQGYPDGSFKPANTVSRVEALKFIFSGFDQEIKKGLTTRFTDTSNDQWYSDFLATAYSLGVVQGYPNGSFKPTQGVNRVEFLKMIFTTMNLPIDPVVEEDPYEDVNNLSWYAPYVAYAKEKNIFPVTGNRFNPAEAMSRLEVAEVVYRLIVVQQNDGAAYSSIMEAK